MCGRFILTSPGIVLAAQFVLQHELELTPRYNIFPTQQVYGRSLEDQCILVIEIDENACLYDLSQAILNSVGF